MPDISVPALNTNTIRTYLVRILHLRYKTTCFPWKNEGSETTLATHRTTHQGPRQRTRQCFLQWQHLQAWTCMDRQESQSNWPKMRKTLGKPGFLSGEDRNRTYECFPNVLLSFERCYSWFCGLLWQMHQPFKSYDFKTASLATPVYRFARPSFPSRRNSRTNLPAFRSITPQSQAAGLSTSG